MDLFATTPSLNYRGNKHYTFLGTVLSVLIYSFLFGYLIYKLNEAFTDPEITSYSLVGQLKDELDFSTNIICLDDYVTSFGDDIDVNTVLYVTNPPELAFKRTYLPRMTTGICGVFEGDSSVNTNNPIHIGVDHSKFLASSVTYDIYYHYIAFDADNIQVPTIRSPKSYVQNKASLQSFLLNFQKAQYNIYKSPLTVFKDKYECPIFSTIEQNSVSNSNSVIQLRYTAQKVVYKIKCLTIPSVLSAVVGLLETITALIVLGLGRFFTFKYYENLANSFKPPGQRHRAKLSALIPYIKKDIKDKEIVDEIKKEQELIESKLDVTTYLSTHIRERDIELYKAGTLD